MLLLISKVVFIILKECLSEFVKYTIYCCKCCHFKFILIKEINVLKKLIFDVIHKISFTWSHQNLNKKIKCRTSRLCHLIT